MLKLILADGQVIDNLDADGTWLISDKEIDRHIFDNNMSTVTVVDGDRNNVFKDQMITAFEVVDGRWWFGFSSRPLEDDTDLMLVDLDYRLTLLELGVTE